MTLGNCHCGSYRFEIPGDDTNAPTTSTDGVCQASVKLGALWLPVDRSAFRVVRDDGKLIAYQSGSLEHEFCSTCGTVVRATRRDASLSQQDTLFVNLRSLEGMDPFVRETASASDHESPIPSPLPSTGSCLCGKVTVTLLAPLEDMSLKEDNCSICTRNAWTGAYPSKAQVALHGTEHVEDYRFGRRFMGHPFCRTCGVHMYMNVYGPPSHVVDRLPEDKQAMVRRNLDIAPVNIRVLDGAEAFLGRLSVERTVEGQADYTLDGK